MVIFLKKIFNLYFEGFKGMKLGRVLWGIILLKLILFFGILKFFVFDENLKNLYPSDEDKSSFVLENLTKDYHNGSSKR